jgi:antitoxin (DNA-binding transcriptional repressor) of toxin-antitoxin stability system
MSTVTAKQLHLETKRILDKLEEGKPLIITRNGQPVGRLEPIPRVGQPTWDDVMQEVWQAQEGIKPSERTENPVIQERRRRRR